MEVAVIITWIGMAIASILNTPQTTVVLIDNDSQKNTIIVETNVGKSIIDKPGQYVQLTSKNKNPSQIKKMSEKEIKERFSSAIEAIPLDPKSFILYFETDTDIIREESRKKLPKILKEIEKRGLVDVNIIGHTDTVGSKKYNYALSLKRAQSVKAWLVNNSSKLEEVIVESYGENDLLIPTEDGISNPKNRRVEILIK